MKQIYAVLAWLVVTYTLHAQTTELWTGVRWGNWGLSEGLVYKTDGNGNCSQLVFAYDDTLTGYGGYGGLVRATNGLVYGTNPMGGLHNNGVLFSIDPVTNVYSDLWDFNSATTGNFPVGNLTQASNGKLYGFTSTGGTYNKGVLFEYDIALDTCIVLHHFNGADGNNPFGSIIEAGNGLFYGITATGGVNNYGTFFEYNPSTTTFTKKHDFNDTLTGRYPQGIGLASNGIIYGSTSGGLGSQGGGTIFDYDINAGVVNHLYQFVGHPDGSNPNGALVEGPNGKLYGTCMYGGDTVCGGGTIFEFDTTTNTLTNITNVCDPNDTIFFNFYTQGPLFMASNGKLYGVTDWTLYEYDIPTHTIRGKVDTQTEFGGTEPRNMRVIEVPRNNSEYVWPGDCNHDAVADNLDILAIGLAYNDSGPARLCPSTDWVASACDNWNDTLPGGINLHHADANGDGIVNADDTFAVALNYGMVHINHPAVPRTGPTDFFLVPDHTTALAGDTIRYDIFLTNGAPVDSLYGIAFSLQFDPLLVDPVPYALSYASSSLGSNLLPFEEDNYSPGEIYAAVTRTDHVNATALSGALGSFMVIISQSATSFNTPFAINPFNVTGVTAGGTPVSFTALPDTIVINAPNAVHTLSAGDCSLYPNPSGDRLSVRMRNATIQKLEISDMAGRVVLREVPGSREAVLDVSSLMAGLYNVSVTTESGALNQKFVVSPH